MTDVVCKYFRNIFNYILALSEQIIFSFLNQILHHQFKNHEQLFDFYCHRHHGNNLKSTHFLFAISNELIKILLQNNDTTK